MAFISKFKSDTAYSNADINEVISAITGAGVLPYSPNDILLNVAGEGVTLSDERCSVSWADEDHTSVKIGTGTVIMPDGSYIIIDNEVFPISAAEKYYIYIYNDLILQNVPKCETFLPEDGRDYVLLAEVENNTIIDRRALALSKIADYGSHPAIETTLTFTIHTPTIPAGQDLCSIYIGDGYSKFIVSNHTNTFVGIYNLKTGLFEKTFTYNHDFISEGFDCVSTNSVLDVLRVRYSDGVLSFYSNRNLYYSKPYDYSLILTIF